MQQHIQSSHVDWHVPTQVSAQHHQLIIMKTSFAVLVLYPLCVCLKLLAKAVLYPNSPSHVELPSSFIFQFLCKENLIPSPKAILNSRETSPNSTLIFESHRVVVSLLLLLESPSVEGRMLIENLPLETLPLFKVTLLL